MDDHAVTLVSTGEGRGFHKFSLWSFPPILYLDGAPGHFPLLDRPFAVSAASDSGWW